VQLVDVQLRRRELLALAGRQLRIAELQLSAYGAASAIFYVENAETAVRELVAFERSGASA
jgi:hypothetical protein